MNELPMTHTDPYSFEALDAEYSRLCTLRDTVEVKVKPMREKLARAAAEAEAPRVAAMRVADELDAAFARELGAPKGKGKHEFIRLKNRLGAVAKLRQQIKDKTGR